MSIILPDNRPLALPTRRGVLLGFGASLLAAPAIVRASSIMPVRRVLITDPAPIAVPERPQEGFVRRLWFDACASGLLQGRITVVRNGHMLGHVVTFSDAERTVRYALKHGFLSRQRTEEIRRLFADG